MTGAGKLFVGAGTVAVLFLGHSALVQWNGYHSAVAFREIAHVRNHYFTSNRPPIPRE